MPRNILQRTIGDSATREPLVRAMILLHAARVLAAVDKDAARQVYAEGVAAAEALPVPTRHFDLILHEAVKLGVNADPHRALALFRRLPVSDRAPWLRSTGNMLVQALAQGGDLESAIGLLEDLSCDAGGAMGLIHLATDPSIQRRAMIAARERWRAQRTQKGSSMQEDFYRLLSFHWQKLDREEGQAWLKEALEAIESDPGQPIRARFGEAVEFDSTRDVHLFHLLNAIRALLAPEEVEGILAAHPRVAAAAKVYPMGFESLLSETARPAERSQSGGGMVGFGASAHDRALMDDVIAARRGDPQAVPRLMDEAQRLYEIDIARPNTSPRVFWPSCNAFKTALYRAGKTQGNDAEPLVAQIPDPDMALLASIELAAGAVGLPQYSGVQME